MRKRDDLISFSDSRSPVDNIESRNNRSDMLLYYSLAAALPWMGYVNAQSEPAPAPSFAPGGTWPTNIVGTWSTKSRSTVTGPGFYNPIKDEFIEPDHTGISYSFTSDGYYEEAFYRAVANPVDPNCPSGLMQWQHGKWVMNANGSLNLAPIHSDGRQMTSEPCSYDNSLFIRYYQPEYFQQYSVYVDEYHNVPRLDLYQFDGAPMQPMYQVYNPPQMLPTTTLNPIVTATATNKAKAKRGLDETVPLNWKAKLESHPQAGHVVHHINPDRLWWIGLGMTGLGGLLYLGPRRMGIQL